MDGELPVRPTRRCLEDLNQRVPPIDEPLHELNDALVREAQRLPEVHAAGGAERILALEDRVWFKVKIARLRGAAVFLSENDQVSTGGPPGNLAPWWLGSGGYRRAGDPSDFYARLAAAAIRAGKSTGGVVTDGWLPTSWDWKRLELELALALERTVRRTVCRLIVRSLRTGHGYRATLGEYSITALARAEQFETYLAIGASHAAEHKLYAVILNSVPGIDSEDWAPEPGKVLGLTPASGETIWSAVLPPGVAVDLLERFPDEEDD